MTPLFEVAEVLERGLGRDARDAAIRFVEPESGEVVALRPDITPQVARLAATRLGSAPAPIRLCYEGAVTRMSRGARHQRELLQAGVELIGAGSPEGDAECVALAAAALEVIAIPSSRLELGHVSLPRLVLDLLATDPARTALRQALASKDRHGIAALLAELSASGHPASAELARLATALPTLFGEPAEVLARARALPLPAAVRADLDLLEHVLARVAELSPGEIHQRITLDLGDSRGFEYYTGLRLAGYVPGGPDAILRGGRYDQLLGRYGRHAPAIGFAVDLEEAAEAQVHARVAIAAPATGTLIAAPAARQLEAARIAAALRAAGARAAIDLVCERSEDERRHYASESGFARVLSLGAGGGSLDGESVDEQLLGAARDGDAAALLEHMERSD
jgi:ATP phosphoribosyltransferase regulatory subunit